MRPQVCLVTHHVPLTERQLLNRKSFRLTRRSSLGLDGEAQFAEDGDGAGFAAFEVGGSEALAGGELVGGAQDRLGRVTALVADQVVGRGRAEAVDGEELVRAEPVVFLQRAQHVGFCYAVPRHHGVTAPGAGAGRRGRARWSRRTRSGSGPAFAGWGPRGRRTPPAGRAGRWA